MNAAAAAPAPLVPSWPPMAIPKNISFVTFDVYGTLIDWETGAYEAFAARKPTETDSHSSATS